MRDFDMENVGLNIHQTREIFENGRVVNYTGVLCALFETANQKEFYDEGRFRQGERPGAYKQHYYGIGEDAGCAPKDTEEEIQALCHELLEAEPKADAPENILKIAAYFHLPFENIHPFADGNVAQRRLQKAA